MAIPQEAGGVPDLSNPTTQTDFRLQHADDTFTNLDTVEQASHSTLPTDMTLAIAQTVDPGELQRAAVLIARTLDFSPTFLLKPATGRQMLSAPLTEFTDPVNGGPVSLATARRLLKPYQVPVMRAMLKHVFNTATPETFATTVAEQGLNAGIPKLRRLDSGLPPTPERVATVVQALAPLEGDTFPWQEALGAAIQIARTDVNLAVLQANLELARRVPNITPLQAISIAHNAAAVGVRFRDMSSVLEYAYPGATAPLEKAGQLIQEKATYDEARQQVLGTPFAPGAAYLPPEAEPASQQNQATVLASGLLAGVVRQTSGDYLKMTKLISERAKIDKVQWQNSFLGKTLTTVGDGLAFAYNHTAGLVWGGWHASNTGDSLAMPANMTGGGSTLKLELGRQFDVAQAIDQGKETIGQAMVHDYHLPGWTTPFVDLGMSFLLDPTIIAGHLVSISRASKLLYELPGSISRGTRAEDVAAKVLDNIDKPLRAFRLTHLGSKRTMWEFLTREALRSENPEKYFLSAVSRFRAYRSTEGIDRTFAAQFFHTARAMQGVGHSVEEIAAMGRELFLTAFGLPPSGLAKMFAAERDAIERQMKERALSDLYARHGSNMMPPEVARQVVAAGTTLTANREEAYLLAVMGDAQTSLLTGPRILHEIPHFSPVTDIFRALSKTGLADTRMAGGLSAMFNKTPRAFFDLHGIEGPALHEQAGTYLRRWRGLFTQQEISAARMTAANIVGMPAGKREDAFMGFVKSLEKTGTERLVAKALPTLGQSERDDLVQELLAISAQTNGLLAQSRLFGVMSFEDPLTGMRAAVRATEPVATTQLLNKMAVADPLVVRAALYGNSVSLTRLDNALRRVYGVKDVTSPFLRTGEVPRKMFDALGLDRAYSGWKRLVVTRPAYVVRVVWLDENLRYAATLGVMSHVESTRSGARVLSLLDKVSGKAPRELVVETPTGERTLVFGRTGLDAVDPAVSVGTKDRAMQESMGEELKRQYNILKGTAGFGGMDPKTAPQGVDQWAKDLNDQIGRAPEFSPILEAIAAGKSADEGARQALNVLRNNPAYKEFLKRIRANFPALMVGEGLSPEEAWAAFSGRMIEQYTMGEPAIARAALDHVVDEQMLNAVPKDRWPDEIHGAELNITKDKKVGYLSRAIDQYSRLILEKPTNALNRHPYYRAWHSAVHEAMVRQAALQGRIFATHEELAPLMAEERRLGAVASDARGADRRLAQTKVVDLSGNPIVVYHGSPNVFEQFDLAKLRHNEPGVFFAENPAVSSDYSLTGAEPARHVADQEMRQAIVDRLKRSPFYRTGGFTKKYYEMRWEQFLATGNPNDLYDPVLDIRSAMRAEGAVTWPESMAPNLHYQHLDIRNPLDEAHVFTHEEAVALVRRAAAKGTFGKTPVEQVLASLDEMLGAVPEAGISGGGLWRSLEQNLDGHQVRASLEAMGFDGIFHAGAEDGNVWIAFRPNQVVPVRRPVSQVERDLAGVRDKMANAVDPARIEGEASRYARGQVRRIMFDMRDQGRLGEMMKYVIPFFQPWAEAFQVWGRILQENPAIIGYAYQAIHQAIDSGFIKRDPQTGELVVPMTNWMGIGPAMNLWMHGPGWQLSAPLSGFNLFFNSTLPIPTGGFAGELPMPFPGFSPPFQTILQMVASNQSLPLSSRLWLSSWVFQNGNQAGVAAFVPRWMLYAADAFGLTAFNQTQIQNMADDFAKNMAAHGINPRLDIPPPTISEADWRYADASTKISDWQTYIADESLKQAKNFMGFRAVISLFHPSAPKVDFPYHELQDELDKLRAPKADGGLGFEAGNAAFIKKYPDKELLTIANAVWNRDIGHSSVPIPPTKAVEQIMSTPEFQRFARVNPQWAWTIIPSEARNGQFDLGVYGDFIAQGVYSMRSPTQLLEEGDRQAGWNAYFPARTQHDQIIQHLLDSGQGIGTPQYDAEETRWRELTADMQRIHPEWSADYSQFALNGTDAVSLASARAVLQNPIFAKTQTASWLREYLPLRAHVESELASHGLHTLDSKAAQTLGLPKMYADGVAKLNKEFPDGKLAFQAFFTDALTVPATDYEKHLGSLPKAKLTALGNFAAKWQTALDAPKFADPGPDKMTAFLKLREMADAAFSAPKGANELMQWWNSRTHGFPGSEQEQYLQNLMGRPYEFLSRFDRQVVLGEPTTDSAEQKWVQLAQDQITVAQLFRTDPLTPAQPVYGALDAQVAAWASEDPVFAKQVQHANQWGWTIQQVLPTVTKGSDSAPYWQSFLADLNQVQQFVDTPISASSTGTPVYLHGPDIDIDPAKKALWKTVKVALEDERNKLFAQSPQFQREWRSLESINGYDSLIDYLMPNTYFPLGGYTLAPSATGG